MTARWTASAVGLLVVLFVWTQGGRSAVPAELQKLSRDYLKSGKTADRKLLASYVGKAKSAESRALARFALGMADYEADSFKTAAAELKRARADAGPLEDYARYFHARALVGDEEHGAAADALADFPRRFPKSRLVPDAARLRIESLMRAERVAEARKLLQSKSALPEPVRLYLLARTQVLEGNRLQAVETYRRVYYKYPLSGQADESEKALNTLRRSLGKRYPSAPSTWRLERADVLFKARQYAEASREYRRALDGLRGTDLDHANVRAGAADYRRLRTTVACNWLSKLKVKTPSADAERIYYLGECARRKSRRKEFAARAEELDRKYPKSPWYEEALFSLGNHYLLNNEARVYRRYYERAARTFPKGQYAARAHWKVCWRAYADSDPRCEALLEEHVRLYANSPTSAAAIYFLGRRAEKARDTSEARTLYRELARLFPHYYYAHRGRARLAKLGGAASQGEAPAFLKGVPGPRSTAAVPTRQSLVLLERGRLLYQLGLDDLSERELRSGDYRRPDGYWIGLELAKQASEQGRHHQGLRYMKRYGFGYLRLPIGAMPREYWERLFPLPYSRQIRARAKPHRLDPHLVAGLIRQESEFNAGAKSRAGALGLMQILPSTGRSLARRVGIKGFATRQLYNPDLSLRLGTLHFRSVLKQFDGQLEYSLAAYNAGERRVEKWMTWGDFSEPEVFVETIPFTETRGYVQAVLRNADVYRRLYGEARRASSGAVLSAGR